MKAEGFDPRAAQLYQDMDGEVPMIGNDHLSLQAKAYPGHLEDEPITIVCGQENQAKTGSPQPENEALLGPAEPLNADSRRGDME